MVFVEAFFLPPLAQTSPIIPLVWANYEFIDCFVYLFFEFLSQLSSIYCNSEKSYFESTSKPFQALIFVEKKFR